MNIDSKAVLRIQMQLFWGFPRFDRQDRIDIERQKNNYFLSLKHILDLLNLKFLKNGMSGIYDTLYDC